MEIVIVGLQNAGKSSFVQVVNVRVNCDQTVVWFSRCNHTVDVPCTRRSRLASL